MLGKLKESNTYKGILLIVLSAFCYSLMTILLKYVTNVPSIQKCFVRNAVTGLLALCIMGEHKRVFRNVNLKNSVWLVLRAVCGVTSMILYYYAVDRMLVANITIISMTAPFFCVLISAVLLKEKVQPYHIWSLLLAFLGILFVVRPGGQSESLVVSIAALLNAAFSACGLVITRILGKKGIDAGLILFVSSVIGIVATTICNKGQSFRLGGLPLFYLLLSGIIGGIGNYFVTLAYKYAPSREISIFDYSQIIFSMLFGIVIFGEFPDQFSIVGYVFVIGAAIYMFQNTRRAS